MRMTHRLPSIPKYLILFAALLILSSSYLQSIQANTFYINLFDKGEAAYLASDYETAIKELKIAVFGLHGNKEIEAKACVYLALSYYNLKDKPNAELYLNKAEALYDTDELLEIGIDESARNDMERLMYTLKSGSNLTAGFQMLPKLPQEIQVSLQNDDLSQLEQQVRNNRQNASAYYDLYHFFRKNYKFKEGKETIEDLVKNIPQEVYGYYLLGIIRYQDKEYKEADESLESFFRLSYNTSVREPILLEVKAYQILTNYLRGEKDKTEELISGSIGMLTREKIRELPLSSRDLSILRGVLEAYLR